MPKKITKHISGLSPTVADKPENAVDDEDIVTKIAVAAYYKAQARGYEPGHEIQDWIEAEAEIQQHK